MPTLAELAVLGVPLGTATGAGHGAIQPIKGRSRSASAAIEGAGSGAGTAAGTLAAAILGKNLGPLALSLPVAGGIGGGYAARKLGAKKPEAPEKKASENDRGIDKKSDLSALALLPLVAGGAAHGAISPVQGRSRTTTAIGEGLGTGVGGLGGGGLGLAGGAYLGAMTPKIFGGSPAAQYVGALVGGLGGMTAGAGGGSILGALLARKLLGTNKKIVPQQVPAQQGISTTASEKKMDKLAFYMGYTEGLDKAASLN